VINSTCGRDNGALQNSINNSTKRLNTQQ